MNFENALIYRRVFNVDDDHVVVEEKWDLSHPESPFASWQPFNPYQTQSVRQTKMTSKQFWSSGLSIKSSSTASPPVSQPTNTRS